MKNVVITGSTRGIGLAMAKEFLQRGCKVIISGRRTTIPNETSQELKSFIGKYQYIPCNVQSKADVLLLWNKAYEKWGQIEIWINNAGQNCPYEYCHDTHESYVDSVIDTNIKGVVFGSQIAAKRH